MLGPLLTTGAYLLGSVSPGLLWARRRGTDLRSVGSGNVGATNVGRALGKRAGRLVLALDAAKGAAPAAVARACFGADSPWTAAVGTAAALGHCYPIWHGFRGGKGAATSVGVMLAISPASGLAAIAGYAALKKLSGRASVGSLGGALLGAVTARAVHGSDPRASMAAALFALVVARHRENLERLWTGREPPS